MASLLLNVLPGQPAFQYLDDVIYLFLREWPAFRNVVPFSQAAPAASPGRVLGDKYRMVPHRRLPAVINRFGIRQPLCNKIPGMLEDYIQTLIREVFRFFAGKPKPAAKLRTPQCGKKFINITHLSFLIPHPDIIRSARVWRNVIKTSEKVNLSSISSVFSYKSHISYIGNWLKMRKFNRWMFGSCVAIAFTITVARRRRPCRLCFLRCRRCR
jgi:hypothetical protein